MDIGLPICDAIEMKLHIGHVVQENRKRKGLNLSDLGRPNTIGNLEKAPGQCKIDTLGKVAKALNTTVAALYAELEESSGNKLATISRENHQDLHEQLQEILEAGGDYTAGIVLNIEAIHKYLQSRPKGRFSPAGAPKDRREVRISGRRKSD